MSAVPNNHGDLVIAVCPDCNWHSVCDPHWTAMVGQTLDIPCENCWGETKDHLLVLFHPERQTAPEAVSEKTSRTILSGE